MYLKTTKTYVILFEKHIIVKYMLQITIEHILFVITMK